MEANRSNMSIDLSNKNNYEILGVKEYSTNSEITEAYKSLKAKYSEDRFLPGEAGNDAALMLQAVENAYHDVMTERKADGFRDEQKTETVDVNKQATTEFVGQTEQKAERTNEKKSSETSYAQVDALIKSGRIDEAQNVLDGYSERHAEWHYLQAVIYYKKNWGNECKKQMEIAIMKDPNNPKYKESYDKLLKEMEFKSKNFSSGNVNMQNDPQRDFDPYDRQMGGNDCLASCCQCLACNMLLNCCCNCH